MQLEDTFHFKILQKAREIKKQINTQDFCKMHGISESKFSRFPSDKLIEEIKLLDNMLQFHEYTKTV